MSKHLLLVVSLLICACSKPIVSPAPNSDTPKPPVDAQKKQETDKYIATTKPKPSPVSEQEANLKPTKTKQQSKRPTVAMELPAGPKNPSFGFLVMYMQAARLDEEDGLGQSYAAMVLKDIPDLPAFRLAVRKLFNVRNVTDKTMEEVSDWLCVRLKITSDKVDVMDVATITKHLQAGINEAEKKGK